MNEIVDSERYEETLINWIVSLMMKGCPPLRVDEFDAVVEIREGRR